MDRNSPLREIKGVGAKTEELFHKIGVYTVGDILLHYPRTYIQYPQAKHVDEVLDGEQAAVLGRITRTPVVRKVRTMQITVTTISEMGASLELVWYRMPYMKNNLKVGSTYIFYGKVNKKNGRLVMEQAAMFTEEQYASMEQVFLPVYTLTNGLSNNLVTKTVRAALGDEHLIWIICRMPSARNTVFVSIIMPSARSISRRIWRHSLLREGGLCLTNFSFLF